MSIHGKNEELLKSIEREYFALTGTKIRDSFSDAEMHHAFEPLLKKYGLKTSLEL